MNLRKKCVNCGSWYLYKMVTQNKRYSRVEFSRVFDLFQAFVQIDSICILDFFLKKDMCSFTRAQHELPSHMISMLFTQERAKTGRENRPKNQGFGSGFLSNSPLEKKLIHFSYTSNAMACGPWYLYQMGIQKQMRTGGMISVI